MLSNRYQKPIQLFLHGQEQQVQESEQLPQPELLLPDQQELQPIPVVWLFHRLSYKHFHLIYRKRTPVRRTIPYLKQLLSSYHLIFYCLFLVLYINLFLVKQTCKNSNINYAHLLKSVNNKAKSTFQINFITKRTTYSGYLLDLRCSNF